MLKSALLIIALICCGFKAYTQSNFETQLQNGHSLKVTAVAVSDNGKLMVSGSRDQSIKLWDRRSGKEIRSFNYHTGTIQTLDFSSDGKRLLSCGSDNKACLIDVLSGVLLHEFKIDKKIMRGAIFSPNEKYVLTMDDRDQVVLWDIKFGNQIRGFKKSYNQTISQEMFDLKAQTILEYKDYKGFTESTWLDTSILNFEFEKPTSLVRSRDGKLVGAGSTKLKAGIFKSDGHLIKEFQIDPEKKCDGCNTLVAFSEDDKYFITAGKGTAVSLWNPSNGKFIKRFGELSDRATYLGSLQNNKYIYVMYGSTLEIFELKSGRKVFSKDNNLYDYFKPTFTSDGVTVLLPDKNNTIVEFTVSNGRKNKSYFGYQNIDRTDGLNFDYNSYWDRSTLDKIDSKSAVDVTSDGRYIAKGRIDSSIFIIDMHTGKRLHQLKGHRQSAFVLRFSPNNKLLASGGGDRMIHLWDVKTGKMIRSFEGHRELIFDINFSNDGKKMVSGGWDGITIVWDVESGKSVKYMSSKNASPLMTKYTNDDYYLAISDNSGLLQIVEEDLMQSFRTVVGNSAEVTALDFFKDELMLMGDWDGRAKLYDYQSGMVKRIYQGHRGRVLAAQIGGDGELCYTAGSDRRIHVWRTDDGSSIKQLLGHDAAITFLKLSDDGKRLFSGDANGTVIIWDLETGQELFSYLQMDRNNWIAKNKYGHFDGTPEAFKWMNYVSGTDVLPVGNFFEKYYTPGLIKRIHEGEHFKDQGMQVGEGVQINLALEGSDLRSSGQYTDTISFWRESTALLKVESDQDDIEEIRIYNNGKLVQQEDLTEEIVFRGQSKVKHSFKIELSAGVNEISAVAVNHKQMESTPVSIKLNYDGEAAKTDLYIVSIGINEYKNPKYNLNFARNDAETFTKELIKGCKPLFNSIVEIQIKNQEATKLNISEALKEIGKKAGPEDVFIFYYAGHGVMGTAVGDKQAEFFLVSHDVTNLYGDQNMLEEKAVSAALLHEYSKQIKAAKQVFVLDACQSGGALNALATRGAGQEKALAHLARSSGTYFLTASQDFQYANEVSGLKHGLFTYAILEVLNGTFKTASVDKKITIGEIKNYIEERVPELAEKYHGTPQYPTSFAYGQDFPLIIVK